MASRCKNVSLYLAFTACPPALKHVAGIHLIHCPNEAVGQGLCIPLLQIRRLRLLEVKPLAQGPTSVCSEAGTRTRVRVSPELAGEVQHFKHHKNAFWELPSCLTPELHHLGPLKRHRIFGFSDSSAKGHRGWEAKVLNIC